MKTYTILFAEDVPHYGTVEIEARNDEEAISLAKTVDVSAVTNDAEWSSSVCKRIVHIEDSARQTVSDGIALDDYFLRSGGEADRMLCDAAPDLLCLLSDEGIEKVHAKLSRLVATANVPLSELWENITESFAVLNVFREKRLKMIAEIWEDEP